MAQTSEKIIQDSMDSMDSMESAEYDSEELAGLDGYYAKKVKQWDLEATRKAYDTQVRARMAELGISDDFTADAVFSWAD